MCNGLGEQHVSAYLLTLTLCSTSFPMMSLSTGCSLTWGVMRDRRQHILCLLFGMPHRVTLTQQIFHIPGLYFFTHIQQPASFLPPGYYGLLSCIKITRLGSSSQSTMCWLIRAESSLALWKVFFYFFNSLFLKNSFQVPWSVRVESMPVP